MKKSNIFIIVSIVITLLIIFGALYFTNKAVSNPTTGNTEENANNVSVVDGKQIIEIKAKGGFSPEHSFAKAGISTTLRVNTNGTLDCSSAIRIPEMNISRNLPISGTTDIDIGVQKVGTFQGTCGMGMYPFDIRFE
jgi:plastocyanin domain-containing protein